VAARVAATHTVVLALSMVEPQRFTASASGGNRKLAPEIPFDRCAV
jgi:hypothetical protein